VTSPKVLLLDQPTLGLDAAASRDARAFIRRWVNDDKARTVVLATNDIREASELCDRVAILNAGQPACVRYAGGAGETGGATP
jgi:ABC-2 type transport system ATP-binding protein